MKTQLKSKRNGRAEDSSIIGFFTLLARHKTLALEMARREITDRYKGQLLGAFWAIGHPLVLVAVYVFIFRFVFKVRIGGTPGMPLDYTTYILAGLIPWLGFQDSMSRASIAIVSNASLVKQVVFPIEVLPVKGAVAAMTTQVVFLILLTIYVSISFHSLAWTYALLPVLVVLQLMAMVGVSYVLSAVGVYLRDTKDLVQIFGMVGVYLVPAFYLPDFVPHAFRGLLYVNPFTYLIWCYQDVLYFGRLNHPWAWPVMVLMSLIAFAGGYHLFRRVKTLFGNML